MDEDTGVKAPVTRLRRRLSVESEGVKSPATPSTPTKKRGTKVAAKPPLELIDENVTKSTPKRVTRKSIVAEPVDEKALTPSRRSTRIRSNTSLVTETALVADSPRAKRAVRRNSQLGSDTEAPVTPARQTRRTRKDSTSSIEKLAVTNPSDKIVDVAAAIAEEPEIDNTNESKVEEQSPSPRKSPRLRNKKGKKSLSEPDNEKQEQNDKTINDQIKLTNETAQTTDAPTVVALNDKADNENESADSKQENLHSKSPKKSSDLNKTTSPIDETNNEKNSKTKLWTTITDNQTSNDSIYEKISNKNDVDDGLTKNDYKVDIKSPNRSINKSVTVFNASVENKENIELPKSDDVLDEMTVKFLAKAPSSEMCSIVMIVDSDSNTGSNGKLVMDIPFDDEDQCVPFLKQATAKRSPRKSESFICEPMDIDETIPENVTINDFSDKNSSTEDSKVPESNEISVSKEKIEDINISSNKSKRTSSISIQQEANVSRRKSSISSLTDNKDAANTSNVENEISSKSKRTLSLSFEQGSNASKRKSSIGNLQENNDSKGDLNKSNEITDSRNKSKRTSSISSNQESNTSKRKSSIGSTEENRNYSNAAFNKSNDFNESPKKSKRTSSISSQQNSNTSMRKSSIGSTEENRNDSNAAINKSNDFNESPKKSKRTSSISSQQNSNTSMRKSSIGSTEENRNDSNAAINKSNYFNESSKKSKRMSISSQQNSNTSKRNTSINALEESSNDSQAANKSNRSLLDDCKRKSSISIQEDGNENANKSKRKSSIRTSSISSQAENNDNNESENSSKRKYLTQIETQNLDKTANENKSNLVLSQLKDDSVNEISNNSKSLNDGNELCKSVNGTDKTEKARNKKKMSSKYLTSTPLQQKSLQKMAMQINTSLISPNVEAKNTLKAKNRSPEKRISNASHNSDMSDDDESENESSRDKSKVIDDEAEEASEDYESGDSRDDEEREYEDAHEIVEKGETLESEEELSNDSDYEKDSFIVSSNEEDNELLSGSDDDLSMSDNELKMNAKSKKKFDERKRKEQKKASKEMYEARHQLDKSDKSSMENKKTKRQRLESEQEDDSKPKKSNRLRIDSSQDDSMKSDANESVCVKKKKAKRLSSVCDDTVADEKEITLNRSVSDKPDPLSIAVKQEPKTPQKDLNISTVLINDNIEEVQIDSNTSLMKINETTDPLQATLAQDEDSDSNDDSEHMEIILNYDSVLDNLNKSKKKIKNLDISLNFDKKSKEKVTEPIIDQLNLTQTKKSKKNKARDKSQELQAKSKETSEMPTKHDESDDGNTSDWIDMHLLFPEDSNDSELNTSEFKAKIVEPAEDFIPLKKSEAKTNLQESTDFNLSQQDSELNDSKKKKKNKNRKLSQCVSENPLTSTDEPNDTSASFFIDTVGEQNLDSSQSSKKKKNKSNKSTDNLQVDMETESYNESQVKTADNTDMEQLLLEVSSKSVKKNKNKSNVEQEIESEIHVESLAKIINTTDTAHLPLEVSFKSDKKKKNKNKSNISISDVQDEVEPECHSEKKKRKKTSESAAENNQSLVKDAAIADELPTDISIKSDKKKKKNKNNDLSINIEKTTATETRSEQKKSKRTSECVADINDTFIELKANMNSEEVPHNESINSEKKKKKKNKDINTQEIEIKSEKKKSRNISESAVEEEMTTNTSHKKEKKKKKKKQKSLEHSQISGDITGGDESDEAPMEVSIVRKDETHSEEAVTDENALNSSKNKKKMNKKKNKNMAQTETKLTDENTTINAQGKGRSKKRKLSKNTSVEDSAPETLAPGSQKKRRKICQNGREEAPVKVTQTKARKRKEREDDDGHKKPKISKNDSFDNIHIPRLPESVVNQLSDKPNKQKLKQKKPKAIATSDFVVEGGKIRKNKPSNYLEQSVYLNDSPVKKKHKAKKNQPKAKVLPFTPTAITSDKGYTSNFRINVLPSETQFVAQASDMANFKNEYLSTQRIKKLGTFERFKKHRNHKISKF